MHNFTHRKREQNPEVLSSAEQRRSSKVHPWPASESIVLVKPAALSNTVDYSTISQLPEVIHRGNSPTPYSQQSHTSLPTCTPHIQALSQSWQSPIKGDEDNTHRFTPVASACKSPVLSGNAEHVVDVDSFTVVDHWSAKNGVGYVLFFNPAKKPLPRRLQQALPADHVDTSGAADCENERAESRDSDDKFVVTDYQSTKTGLVYTLSFAPAKKPLLHCLQQARQADTAKLLDESNRTFEVVDSHSEKKSTDTAVLTPMEKSIHHHTQAPTSPDPSVYSDTSDSESESESEDESGSDSSDDEEDCHTPAVESSSSKKFEDFSEQDQICVKLNIEIAMRSVKGAGFGNPQKWARPPLHPRVKQLRLDNQLTESKRAHSQAVTTVSPLIHCMIAN